MKKSWLLILMFTLVSSALAQERLSDEETQKYAKFTHKDLKLFEKAPLRVEADLPKAVGMKDEQHGGMLIPDAKLTAEALAKAGKEPVAVGEMWFYRLAPLRDGQVVAASDLFLVPLETDEGAKVTLPLSVLGACKNDQGDLELLVYGKAKEPLLKLPLKKAESPQGRPLDWVTERESDAGKVTLKILGKYEATFKVTELEIN